ncbi:WD40 repeat domain-containing protein [Rhizobium leguminosarum]
MFPRSARWDGLRAYIGATKRPDGEALPGGGSGHHKQPISRGYEIDNRLVSSSGDRTFCLWTLNGEFISEDNLDGHGYYTIFPLYSNFLTSDYFGAISIWDADGNLVSTSEAHGSHVEDIIVLVDSFVSCAGDGSLCWWDLQGPRLSGGSLRAHPGQITDLFEIGSVIVSVGGNVVRLWSLDGENRWQPGFLREISSMSMC